MAYNAEPWIIDLRYLTFECQKELRLNEGLTHRSPKMSATLRFLCQSLASAA